MQTQQTNFSSLQQRFFDTYDRVLQVMRNNTVQLRGYLAVCDEGVALYFSQDDYDSKDKQRAIWLRKYHEPEQPKHIPKQVSPINGSKNLLDNHLVFDISPVKRSVAAAVTSPMMMGGLSPLLQAQQYAGKHVSVMGNLADEPYRDYPMRFCALQSIFIDG
ncbi:hypothetical protein LJC55_01970 [Eubacteriales bacterium OttesenSCG-928-N14]|nr:hypothetical protein [Eubacteriales bacterium OttesenSCG-928-N14]